MVRIPVKSFQVGGGGSITAAGELVAVHKMVFCPAIPSTNKAEGCSLASQEDVGFVAGRCFPESLLSRKAVLDCGQYQLNFSDNQAAMTRDSFSGRSADQVENPLRTDYTDKFGSRGKNS